jgi:hypothetical protein
VSAIAECYIVTPSALPAIRDAAMPKKSFLGKPKDTFFDVLRSQSSRRVEYGWSGYVIATLLPYLDDQGVRLMKSSHDDLAHELSDKRQATFFVLTREHSTFLAALDPAGYTEADLQDYYEHSTKSRPVVSAKPCSTGSRCCATVSRQWMATQWASSSSGRRKSPQPRRPLRSAAFTA